MRERQASSAWRRSRWRWLAPLLGCLAPALAGAEGWRGIEPGVSRRDDVVAAWGQPASTEIQRGREVLTYAAWTGTEGARLVNVLLEAGGDTVASITVLPDHDMDRNEVEHRFGPRCPAQPGSSNCYQTRLTQDFRTQLFYPRLGVSVFFNDKGTAVQSLVFQAPRTDRAKAATPAPPPVEEGHPAVERPRTAPAPEVKPPPEPAEALSAAEKRAAAAAELQAGVFEPRTYRPLRTESPPAIDGKLDDPVWQLAPREGNFLSQISKPYGQPAVDPTEVQLAYDEKNLYVAFRCKYGASGPRDDTVPPNEQQVGETVAVYIDPKNDHTNALAFGVTRAGYRSDWELTRNGTVLDFEWRGIWNAATQRDENGWTAELVIPWGTLALPSHDEKEFSVGVNFNRLVPLTPESAAWVPRPAGYKRPSPAYFGTLIGLHDVPASQRLYIEPYFAVAYQSNQLRQGRLRDLLGNGGNTLLYGGLYARARPLSSLQIDLTINPDFSQVSPDSALANVDRFELFFPEVRDFFVQDLDRFTLGTDRYQLFYSRRVGVRKRLGGWEEVPINYGAKVLIREKGFEGGILNVDTAPMAGPVEMGKDTSVPEQNITVARLNKLFGNATHLGMIFLNRAAPTQLGLQVSDYRAYGADGAYGLLHDRLILSGFWARSESLQPVDLTEGPIFGYGLLGPTHLVPGVAGNATIQWISQEFQASASYVDVSHTFDPQLGFFEQVGIRRNEVSANYNPQTHIDLVHDVSVGAKWSQTTDVHDAIRTDARTLSLGAALLDTSVIQASLLQTTDAVDHLFKIAGRRLIIPPGTYDANRVSFFVGLPQRRTTMLSLGYTEGGLFGGHERILTLDGRLNLGPFTGGATYQFYEVHAGPSMTVLLDENVLRAHRLSARLMFAFTPDLRTNLAVEASTFDPTATLQWLTSWRFSTTGQLTLVASRTGPSVWSWVYEPEWRALLKLSYGLVLF